ncbi:MAG: SDR family oxidoreductase [Nocardioides sp.]|uniref:SDR family NAD(P)-dependent oxidoreductase n=1 Tax=Nocardioides sp. TaxID=35761 RepID=UPI0032666D01
MSGFDLTDRTALVTGGAQGLGEGMAKALAAAGAKVMIADVQDSGADTAAALGDGHAFVRLQIRKMLDVNVLGTALGLKHGLRTMRPGGAAGKGGSIINVASVAATIAFPGIAIYSATKSAVDRLTKVAAMEAGKLGTGVRVNCIYPGLVPTAMGAGLANDVAEIGLFGSAEEAVGAVIELTPAGRLGTVEDMADAVVFLASDASRFVTGAGLPVDGGMGM